jgi:hypothetical protein
MSAAEQGDNNGNNTQIVSLLRKALSFAQRALRALQAAGNAVNVSNANPFTPAPTVTLSAPAYATRVGTTVNVEAYSTGNVSVAEDVVQIQILMDGVGIPQAIGPTTQGATGAPHAWALAVRASATVAVGASHVFAAQVIDSSGGNLQIPARGVQIFITENPA